MEIKLYNHAQGIYLSLLQLQDADKLLQLRLRNRAHHQPYEPLREADYFTLESQELLLSQRISDAEQDRAYMFGIFLTDGQLIGQVTLSNLVRGVAQYADLGYFIDYAIQSKGHMTAAVRLILEYAFRGLALHRVQASILLHNDASRRVLEKSGFQAEGVARRYLKINGDWQDHRTYAILADDFLTARP
ncbi:acetyltransferase [Paenibacillus sp. FSL R7-0273]|uniref:GNAT family N-acetyltransferase n=1 Tax=Paenibacillus sp. FSL R7-0273 TaxID=1536772 RepID=UPI0004F87CE8|nr:GNAT family protein [Paenibacillus sp. FSL R7-0273]AIQ44556.1 acetyltransferase [Paenibacillus sp. FSL R7-0273]OMF85103.1 GNAT family N-acetyltransferase [Paenibacillus sp. FSL R7-0273]